MNNKNKLLYDCITEGLNILSSIFWGPDTKQCKMLLQGKLNLIFEPVAEKPETGIRESLLKLNFILESFGDAESLDSALNEEYVRLFVNNRDGIEAPLYESCYDYENAQLMGPSATRMKNLFETSGLTLSDSIGEPPDHLSIELEYLYFLLISKDKEAKDRNIKKACDFVSGIMIPWVEIFYKKLAEKYPDSFYTHSAHILPGLLGLIRNIDLLDR